MIRPLGGLLVVGLEQAVAAPLATRHLADLGARVIKVERPGSGDIARDYDDAVNGLAAHFVWCNRGKESLTLDVDTPEGAEVLEVLLGRADIFVQNLAPGAAARRGLAAAQVQGRHPRIISVDISGYGEGGPLAHKRAYDLLIQAEAASCSITGQPGQPAKPGVPLADIGAAMYAYSSILTALLVRSTSGRGTAISVSLFDSLAEWMGYAVNFTLGTEDEQEPIGIASPAVAPYGAYPTADERVVVLGTTNDQEWQRLARTVLNRLDLAVDPILSNNRGRVAARQRLDKAISEWSFKLSLEHAQDELDRAGIGNARLNGVQDLIDHPQLSQRNRWRTVDSPVGPIPTLLPPPVFRDWGFDMKRIPSLGEHTSEILDELGYEAEQISHMHEIGVV